MAERPSSMVSAESEALAVSVPLLDHDESYFPQPRAPFATMNGAESPRESFLDASPTRNSSGTLLATKNEPDIEEERVASLDGSPPSSRRRPLLVLLALMALIAVVLAVILPVYFTIIRPRHKSSALVGTSSSNTSGGPTAASTNPGAKATPSPSSAEAITGGDGSTITASDGTTFTYSNQFGGIWWSDPNDPYNNNAYPNSWTPPLNQSWDYGNDRIYGVNLGGWFVLEPFITPALYQKYPGAVDEWTLSTLMAADTANGGLSQIETHYQTFITEQDIAQIAGAGLNWVRIPIPFWAIDTWGDEPFLAKTSWKYIVQAIQWCRKYGIRVNLDLHTIPGSQNAFNHSGKEGQVNFLYGVMGMANAQRAMNYIRIITEFISQPEYKDVVPIFGIMNEALISTIGTTELRAFYVEVYNMIRGITGVGEGNGPFISIHDGFQSLSSWVNFMTGADRIALDSHPYFAFDDGAATDPIATGTGADAGGVWPSEACNRWTDTFNASRNAFGVTYAGEWSNGFNDCGLFLKGVPGSHTYGGDCDVWQDSSNWNASTKAGISAFASASMDALRDWFFWTWKIDNSTAGIVESPLWSYQLGLQGGWIPTDPRSAIGFCGPSTGPVFDGTFDSWMTGGAGAGTVSPDQTTLYPWPPVTLETPGVPASELPVYTSAGSIVTLPVPTFTNSKGNVIDPTADGWFNTNDNAPGPTPIAGCSYPDAWNAVDVPVPTGCTGGANAAVPAAITPPPSRRSQ